MDKKTRKAVLIACPLGAMKSAVAHAVQKLLSVTRQVAALSERSQTAVHVTSFNQSVHIQVVLGEQVIV